MSQTLVTASFTVIAPARLLTVNAERKINRYQRAEIVRAWRWASKLEARNAHLPPFEWAEIDVSFCQARGVLADCGAHYPVTKAVVDGLVDGRVLPGDGREHVRGIYQHPPMRGPDAVTVTIKGAMA